MGADFQEDMLADGLRMEEVEARLERSRNRILQSAVTIILCLDMQVMDNYPDPLRSQAEYIMAVQSVALAGGTLLLAAHAEGLGGVWMCAPLFAPETVRRVLSLPAQWQPQGMILLGYPAQVPEAPPRRSVKEVTVYL
jgi:F420 biosynthesis protein FbiB-like protein